MLFKWIKGIIVDINYQHFLQYLYDSMIFAQFPNKTYKRLFAKISDHVRYGETYCLNCFLKAAFTTKLNVELIIMVIEARNMNCVRLFTLTARPTTCRGNNHKAQMSLRGPDRSWQHTLATQSKCKWLAKGSFLGPKRATKTITKNLAHNAAGSGAVNEWANSFDVKLCVVVCVCVSVLALGFVAAHK